MDNARRIAFLYKGRSVPARILERIRDTVPEGFELSACDETASDAERQAAVAQADFLMIYATPFTDVIGASKARLVQLLSAGYDKVDTAGFAAAGVPVADNGGANAPTVAEHALMLMLTVMRKLPLHHNSLQDGEWLGLTRGLELRELRGRRVGIVGFGRIGRDVARMVRGFLAEPVYCDAVAAPPEVEAELGATRLPLDELLASSDIVTLHTPLTEDSHGLIDAAALERMKPTAFLINTSRGPVVDEAALVAALDAGRIAGAGLDVFESEPIAAGHPLLGRDNVVLTPHTAGTTIDTWTRRIEFAFGNIQRVAGGDGALSVVNGV